MTAVNSRSKPYHHGDLRAALLRAGLDLLATRTADDLSLREIARTVGVSANAVYRHFADKESLMQALAVEGLQMLYLAQRAAAEAAGGGVAGFKATGVAYVRFAMANPALYRQIFSSSPEAAVGGPDHAAGAMALLRANAASVAASPAQAEVVALEAWSLAHGLAMLMLDRQTPVDETMMVDVFAHWAVGLDLRHVAARPAIRPASRRAEESASA